MSTLAASTPSLSTRELFLAMLGISVVTVLAALDSTLVGTSLPRVVQELGGLDAYPWVGIAYLITSAIAIPICGRLGDLFGRKRFIVLSLYILGIGSILCAVTPSMMFLVFARAFQGLGNGMMIGTAFATPVDLFPDPKQRVKWLAMISTSFAVSSGLGPFLGGYLTDTVGWRMTFLVVPAVAVYGVWHIKKFLPKMRLQHTHSTQIDWVGGLAIVFVVACPLLALKLALVESPQWWLVGLLSLLTLFSGLTLYIVEPQARSPMLPLHIFSSKAVCLIILTAFFVGSVMFVLVYYSPLLLQAELALSPTQTGMIVTPLVAMIPVGSLINGRIFPKISDPRRLLYLGALLLGTGCALLLKLDTSTSLLTASSFFAVCGLGLGFLLPNMTLFMQMVADRRDIGVASGLVQTTRSFGSAVGVALVGVAIQQTSILRGMHIGLYLLIGYCLLIVLISSRIHIKNK